MRLLIKTVILSLSIVFSTNAGAALSSQEIPYYGEEFFRELKAGVSNKDMLMRLKVVLRVSHTVIPGSYDELGTGCGDRKYECYQHVPVGYDRARVFLLGNYYLAQDGSDYKVWDVYCNTFKTKEDFGRNNGPAPGRIPNNNIINVEHTWPQSRFSGRYPKDMQKSDLHHLYPTDNKINGARGNYKFGEVVRDKKTLHCPESRFGTGAVAGMEIFEPPSNHKGNVARALFYFSTKYDLPIDPNEEATLKKWHHEDPVDEEEMNRNIAIFEAQGSRNPFIDYPELADRVSDF
ncbi:Extracellular ribonuclease precursor [compost metagenome]